MTLAIVKEAIKAYENWVNIKNWMEEQDLIPLMRLKPKVKYAIELSNKIENFSLDGF